MERRQILLPVRALVLATLLVSGIAVAKEGEPQSAAAPAVAAPAEALSTGFTYQGQLEKDGSPVNDACEMAFRLYDQATSGAQVGSAITATVPITDGLFTVTLDFGAGAFNGDRRWLGIAVDCEGDGTYDDLGRQELTAAPYALYAARSGGPENVVTVAKSGGDYTSVQAAIDSITDAAADNAYLVWVAPGVYSETVRMKPYVHLQGAGQEATVITSDATSNNPIPDRATLVLTQTTSLRDLTVVNNSVGLYNVALLATAGMGRPLVADVTARTWGGGTYNYAIFLGGSKLAVTLQQVTALAGSGDVNCGLFSVGGAGATLRGGSFTARGGTIACGIENYGSGTTLDAEGVSALGQYGSVSNYGLVNSGGAEAVLRVGSFTGHGGTDARGIYNQSSGTRLEAESVTALAEDGSDNNYALTNGGAAEAALRGGSFTGRGGGDVRGISNSGSGTTLDATGVTALGESDGDRSFALANDDGAEAALHGGSFTGRGGQQASGLINSGSGTRLEAVGVTALGEDGGSSSCGLVNVGGAEAILRGGSFIGRGGLYAAGFVNSDSGTALEAEGVIAVGENGSSTNYGLGNSGSATAEVGSSQLTGSSGGLWQDDGTVYLGVTQLNGGAHKSGGMLTCFQVYSGSYGSYTCP
jgi:hypothetical protein